MLVVGAGAVVLLFGLIVAVVAVARVASQPATNPPGQQAPTAAQVAPAESDANPTVVGSIGTPPTPGYMAITPNGRYGYVTNRDTREVTVLDLGTRATVATIPIPAAPRFVAFDRASTRAYISCYDNTGAINQVLAVDMQTFTVTAAIPVDAQPYLLAVAPGQRTLWVPSHSAGSIDLVNTDSNTVTRSVPVPQNPHGVVFTADRAYVVNHESNLVTVLNAADATILATIPVGLSPHAAAVSPDESRLAVVNYYGNNVSMIDTASNQVVATIPVGQGPQNVSYAPDGRHIYTADVNGGTVSVIDSTTNQVTATVPVGTDPTSVTPAPDGRLAYVTLLNESRLVTLSTAR